MSNDDLFDLDTFDVDQPAPADPGAVAEVAEATPPLDLALVVCGMCGGDGRVLGNPCRRCNGTGRVAKNMGVNSTGQPPAQAVLSVPAAPATTVPTCPACSKPILPTDAAAWSEKRPKYHAACWPFKREAHLVTGPAGPGPSAEAAVVAAPAAAPAPAPKKSRRRGAPNLAEMTEAIGTAGVADALAEANAILTGQGAASVPAAGAVAGISDPATPGGSPTLTGPASVAPHSAPAPLARSGESGPTLTEQPGGPHQPTSVPGSAASSPSATRPGTGSTNTTTETDATPPEETPCPVSTAAPTAGTPATARASSPRPSATTTASPTPKDSVASPAQTTTPSPTTSSTNADAASLRAQAKQRRDNLPPEVRPADLETAWSACVAKNERALDLKAALEKAERERTDAERRYDELVSVKERREASEMASASLEERAAEIEVARARAEAEAATAAAALAAETKTRAASVRERAVPTSVDAREANRSGPSDYAAIAGMNWSTLKHMARSPKMFQYRLEHPEPPKAAYDFGRAFHCALLEPKVFLERFAVAPDCDGRTKAGKAELAAWRALNVGREAISQKGMDTILGMSEAVRAHKVAGPLIDGVLAEETITWTDAETGILCKARLDMLGRDFLADVKTTRDPAPRAFARDAAQHLYVGQLAFYYDGAVTSGRLPKYTKPPFIICPEKTEPYDVVVFRLHQNLALEPGRALYRRLLRRFLECSAAEWWPGISPELTLLELPNWDVEAEGSSGDFDLEDVR